MTMMGKPPRKWSSKETWQAQEEKVRLMNIWVQLDLSWIFSYESINSTFVLRAEFLQLSTIDFLAGRGCPVCCRVLSSILGFYPWNGNSHPTVVTTKSVSSHCQMLLRRQNHFPLRTTGSNQCLGCVTTKRHDHTTHQIISYLLSRNHFHSYISLLPMVSETSFYKLCFLQPISLFYIFLILE